MATRSALLNVMMKAADKAARGLKRDFGEIENLQVSRKGPADFVSAADLVVPGDTNGIADVFVRHHCPLGAPDYCGASTRRVSTGAGGAQTDGDSYGPRMSHDPFSAWAITFISEASNILPDDVPIPNDGNIYLDLAYE